MAKGDLISAFMTATGNFQPAAGVEVMLVCLSPTGANEYWFLYDGAQSGLLKGANTFYLSGDAVPINNTNYLRYFKTTFNAFYGGVQIK